MGSGRRDRAGRGHRRYAVGLNFRNILTNIDPSQLPLQLRVELLVPAGLLYLLGPPVLVHVLGAPAPLRSVTMCRGSSGCERTTSASSGSTFPGRSQCRRCGWRCSTCTARTPVPVGVTAVYETLTSMAAGALLGVLFLPALWVLPTELSGKSLGAGGGSRRLPIALGVLNKLAARIAKKKRGPDARPLAGPIIISSGARALARGLRVLSAGVESRFDYSRADPGLLRNGVPSRSRWTWRPSRSRTWPGS